MASKEYCYYEDDWIWSATSNVHVARCRHWFTKYTPFTSHTEDLYCQPGVAVKGVGDVELQVRRVAGPAAKNRRGDRNSTIILRDVLHAPDSVCNVLGSPVMGEFQVQIGQRKDGMAGSLNSKVSGATKALFEPGRFKKLWLKSHPPNRPSSLNQSNHSEISIRWPETERSSWIKFKQSAEYTASTQDSTSPQVAEVPRQATPPELAADEEQWLKENYGSLSHLLDVHGLPSIFNDDRMKGREIARREMREDLARPPEDTWKYTGHGWTRGPTSVQMERRRQVANAYFAGKDSLALIESHYKSALSFFDEFKLSPLEHKDCMRALDIKWELLRVRKESLAEAGVLDPPEYSAEELAWVRVHHKDEAAFLSKFGLNFGILTDRAKGRVVARALMKQRELEASAHRKQKAEEELCQRESSKRPAEELSMSEEHQYTAEEKDFLMSRMPPNTSSFWLTSSTSAHRKRKAEDELSRSESSKRPAEALSITGEPPYTVEEKQWLKSKGCNEYQFLQSHGLSIHNEEDRAEGRKIVRLWKAEDRAKAEVYFGDRSDEPAPTFYHIGGSMLDWSGVIRE